MQMTENEMIAKKIEDDFILKNSTDEEVKTLTILQNAYTIKEGKAVFTILAATNMVTYRNYLLDKYEYNKTKI